MIESEDDVRAYVRQASAGRARWVEPALGSTPGLPDCWVPMRCGRQVHLELKAGVIKGGVLQFTVRPEQRREIRALLRDSIPVGLLIGIEGTGSVVFAKITTTTLSGLRNLDNEFCFLTETKKVGGFWSGVNFIFSDFQKGL